MQRDNSMLMKLEDIEQYGRFHDKEKYSPAMKARFFYLENAVKWQSKKYQIYCRGTADRWS